MKFSLNNPDKLTSNQFSKIKTDEERKVFFSSFWTTLDSYRKLKSWECVMLKVKQAFDVVGRLVFARTCSAVLVHTNGWARSCQPSMKARILVLRSLTWLEDAAADGLAFDDAEPDLHEVHPGGVGRGEVGVEYVSWFATLHVCLW